MSTNYFDIVDNGALIETVQSGATDQLFEYLSGSGIIQQSGPGTLVLETYTDFDGTLVVGGGMVELSSASSIDNGSVISFTSGQSGTLQLDENALPGYVEGFAAGDAIDLEGLSFSGTTTATVSGNTVSVTENGQTAVIVIAGASASAFVLSHDGAGGT